MFSYTPGLRPFNSRNSGIGFLNFGNWGDNGPEKRPRGENREGGERDGARGRYQSLRTRERGESTMGTPAALIRERMVLHRYWA